MNMLGFYIGYAGAAIRYSIRKPRRIPSGLHGVSHYFR